MSTFNFSEPSTIGFGVLANEYVNDTLEHTLNLSWTTTTYFTIFNDSTTEGDVIIDGNDVAVLPAISLAQKSIFNSQIDGKIIDLSPIMTYQVDSGNLVNITQRKQSNNNPDDLNYLWFAFSNTKCIDFATPAPIGGFWQNFKNCIEILNTSGGSQIVELPVIYSNRMKTNTFGNYYQVFYYFDISSDSFTVTLRDAENHFIYYDLCIPNAANSYDWITWRSATPYFIKGYGSITINNAIHGRYCIDFVFYEDPFYSPTPYLLEFEVF